jgi:hypothetical protein
VSLTEDFYMGRKIASEDAARVLEIIGRPEPEDFLGWILATDLRKPSGLRFWLPELDLNQQPCD